jgi:hypothetical protein
MILPLSSEAGRAIRGGNFTLRLLGMAAGAMCAHRLRLKR